MVKIAFHTPQIDIRGSCVAVYDYALHNEIILKNESIIISDIKNKSKNNFLAVKKFYNRFPLFFYQTKAELHKIISAEMCDVLYTIKYGKRDEIIFKNPKTVIHCVFDLSEPHGEVYAAVSESLARKYNYPLFVPHMVGLNPSVDNENLREKLDIPKFARVFGRYGGLDTFNIKFVFEAIIEIISSHKDIYFLFINTPFILSHPQIKYLDPIISEQDKNLFIQTCDAHLECGTLGHTFGLAMAEFSVNNKPIICYKGNVWNTAHYKILKDKALYFHNKEEFIKIITTFNSNDFINRDLNCYKEYSPEKVMKKFSEVFLK